MVLCANCIYPTKTYGTPSQMDIYEAIILRVHTVLKKHDIFWHSCLCMILVIIMVEILIKSRKALYEAVRATDV